MQYPSMRVELIGYLRGLADATYQLECWVKGNCPPGVQDNLDLAIHFLFDDTHLASDPRSVIGVFLVNESEADRVHAVCGALDRIFAKYGTDKRDAFYIACKEWDEVIALSQIALATIQANERA